jgi:hypothetical protein
MLFFNYIKFLFFSNVHKIVFRDLKLPICTNDDSNVMEPDCEIFRKWVPLIGRISAE